MPDSKGSGYGFREKTQTQSEDENLSPVLCTELGRQCPEYSPHPNPHWEMRQERNRKRGGWTDVSQPQFVFLPITAGALGSEPLGWGPSELHHHSH